MKKKITIMCLHTGMGGIENYVASLAKMLIPKYEVKIVSTYKVLNRNIFNFKDEIEIDYLINDYPKKERFKQALKKKDIIRILSTGFSLLKILFLKYYKNIIAIKKSDADYIITTRDFHNKLVGKYRKKGVVTIATEHNYHNNDKKYIKKVVNSCRKIDYLVLVSKNLKDFYEKKLVNTKCIYIPNTIERIPKYKEKEKLSNKLISVGRLVEEKGFSDLIDIIYLLKKRIPNIILDIYGDGELKDSLYKKIKSKKLDKNINLKGAIFHDELLEIMKEYDLYLMSSYTESFGLVILEAFSNSVPVVAFDSADGALNLLKNERGVLIKNRNKEDYANAVYNLLNDMKKMNQISKNGYDSLKKYTMDNVRKKWEELLDNSDY